MARAASTARSTSAALTSRCLPEIATTPRLLTPRMWPPATPAHTRDDLHAGHLLGLGHRLLDGLDGGVDVDDHALAQAARGARAHADDVEAAARRRLGR